MIDHLVYATDDLERTVASFTDRFRVAPTPGGRHLGWGTRNELVGPGDGAYLELVGPDRGQHDPDGPRPFGIDDLVGERLITWCARPDGTPAFAPAPVAARYQTPRGLCNLNFDVSLESGEFVPLKGPLIDAAPVDAAPAPDAAPAADASPAAGLPAGLTQADATFLCLSLIHI